MEPNPWQVIGFRASPSCEFVAVDISNGKVTKTEMLTVGEEDNAAHIDKLVEQANEQARETIASVERLRRIYDLPITEPTEEVEA